ncbi:hypothetical protein ACMDB5_10405 [Flavobacterium sp. W1B]|uniref:hypothetical protein n=1 Tax=Flavobacterium sp. W1B TaxID=3394146 RepID=UPI0039BCCD0C
MEYEDNISIIENLISLLSNKIFGNLIEKKLIMELINLRDEINTISNKNINNILIISDLITEELHYIYSKLSAIYDSLRIGNNLEFDNVNELKQLTRILQSEIRNIKNKINIYVANSGHIYNSEKFYDEQIKELEKQKADLQNYLAHQKNIEGKSQDEIAQHKKIIKEKEIAILNANEQIKNYQTELEEKKKKENVIVEWNNKIKSTFEELTECLSPIKDEHKRLNLMFWIYSILITLIISTIILLEIYIFYKLNENKEFPEWKNYLASIIPIPVFGGLLWGFITQLNRTQRQLLVIAKHIHEIRYIEGLLLSINSLSLDINDSTKRVNMAIDRLLENHLNSNSNGNSISEESILNEEKKDSLPIDAVIKLLKETKNIIAK